MEFNNNNT
jgi:hypothetical protein